MAVQNSSTCQGLWRCGDILYTMWRGLFGNNFSDTLDETSLAQWAQCSQSEPDMHLLVSPEVPSVSQSHVGSLIILFHASNLSVWLYHRRTCAMSVLMAPGCKAALALLSCSQIWRSGTLSSVTLGPSPLLAVLPQFLPAQLSQYILPKHCQKLHNSTITALHNRALSSG